MIPAKQEKTERSKTLLFSITAKDFEMQTFSVGGHGGAGKDTSNSGVRLIHKDSGARGEGRESRSVTLNRRSALKKLIETKEFKNWHKIECARRMNVRLPETPEQIKERVNKMVVDGLADGSILVEEIE